MIEEFFPHFDRRGRSAKTVRIFPLSGLSDPGVSVRSRPAVETGAPSRGGQRKRMPGIARESFAERLRKSNFLPVVNTMDSGQQPFFAINGKLGMISKQRTGLVESVCEQWNIHVQTGSARSFVKKFQGLLVLEPRDNFCCKNH